MKTSIDLPGEILNGIRKYNKEHPSRKIIIGGVCRVALKKELEKALGENTDCAKTPVALT